MAQIIQLSWLTKSITPLPPPQIVHVGPESVPVVLFLFFIAGGGGHWNTGTHSFFTIYMRSCLEVKSEVKLTAKRTCVFVFQFGEYLSDPDRLYCKFFAQSYRPKLV
jgi:hypothetical protein